MVQHPGGDDVIERTQPQRRQGGEVGLDEAEVGEPAHAGPLARHGERGSGEVEGHDLRGGIAQLLGQEEGVVAGAAAGVEDAEGGVVGAAPGPEEMVDQGQFTHQGRAQPRAFLLGVAGWIRQRLILRLHLGQLHHADSSSRDRGRSSVGGRQSGRPSGEPCRGDA